MQVLSKDRTAVQRNITPSFVIMKSNSRPKVGKNGQKNTIK
jgi:hypothetical protein